MNVWARYDDEDHDFIHFSGKYGKTTGRRHLFSIHVDDLMVLISEEEHTELLARLEDGKVFCFPKLNLAEED